MKVATILIRNNESIKYIGNYSNLVKKDIMYAFDYEVQPSNSKIGKKVDSSVEYSFKQTRYYPKKDSPNPFIVNLKKRINQYDIVKELDKDEIQL